MLKTKEEIEKWLDKMEIENYTINEDLTVDVKGNIDISYKKLTEIPIQFGTIEGDFYCYSNRLTTLEGVPEIVKGWFICSGNNLTSLEGGPEIVKGGYVCNANSITSFEHLPLKAERIYHDGIKEQGITESATLEELKQRNDIIKAKKSLEEELKSKDLTKEQIKRPKMKI